VFKLLSDQTEGRLAVFEEIVPPRLGTPLHIHQTSDEAIYVVSGQFSSGWGETTHAALAGSWIFIPMGSVHGEQIRHRQAAQHRTHLRPTLARQRLSRSSIP
jgi:quercetin dioxygenase-like cupin family protein